MEASGSASAESKKSIDKRLQDWTKNEIFDLLQNIELFGSRNVTQIAKNIPTKTKKQITKAIEYYRERAVQQVNVPNKRNIWPLKTKSNRAPVPLMSWPKFLQDSLNCKELQTETATALRLIAEFDNIPSAEATENVDFKNVYHSLANAMEGKPIPDDAALATILKKCIVDTALTSKEFMRIGTLQNIVESIDMSEKPASVLPWPTDNIELATLRHLASQRAYNPLNISEQHLKPG